LKRKPEKKKEERFEIWSKMMDEVETLEMATDLFRKTDDIANGSIVSVSLNHINSEKKETEIKKTTEVQHASSLKKPKKPTWMRTSDHDKKLSEKKSPILESVLHTSKENLTLHFPKGIFPISDKKISDGILEKVCLSSPRNGNGKKKKSSGGNPEEKSMTEGNSPPSRRSPRVLSVNRSPRGKLPSACSSQKVVYSGNVTDELLHPKSPENLMEINDQSLRRTRSKSLFRSKTDNSPEKRLESNTTTHEKMKETHESHQSISHHKGRSTNVNLLEAPLTDRPKTGRHSKARKEGGGITGGSKDAHNVAELVPVPEDQLEPRPQRLRRSSTARTPTNT